MPSAKRITLPESQEIMRRLTAVYDDTTMVEQFYPLIAQKGGERKTAEGVAYLFLYKAGEFLRGYPAVVRNALLSFVPLLIDALIDDKEVAEEAKTYLKRK